MDKKKEKDSFEKKNPVSYNTAPKRIARIQFGTLMKEEMERAAEFEVSNKDLTNQVDRTPATNGCLDPRLGISDKFTTCQTCNKKLAECVGHFGFIKLRLPVFHTGYFKHTITILQCICKTCSRIMLSEADRDKYLRIITRSNKNEDEVNALTRAMHFKRIIDLCKRARRCPHCDTSNGVVKKITGAVFKVAHEKYRAKAPDLLPIDQHKVNLMNDKVDKMIIRQGEDDGGGKKERKKWQDISTHLNKGGIELLHPLKVYELFCQITSEDAMLLWMDESYGRPESLIMWAVPVPPVPIRPSVPVDVAGGGTTEDDLTVKLQEIIYVNHALSETMNKGGQVRNYTEDWEYLQVLVAQFINGETPGIPRAITGNRSIRGLCQRLKGKQGRFRGNLSGKRVDFSGRTVISPDPNLEVQQVGIPEHVAKIMTYPERVFEHNKTMLQNMVINGHDIWPGANLVRKTSSSAKGVPKARLLAYLDEEMRKDVAKQIKVGDIVERHMKDGDVVMFNRQPSLHKMSIMAHRVKVMPFRTFRFNVCACAPYNADFDGDEMNLHLPQTEEARVEAAELMAISRNLITPRNGEPLVAATQDFLSCSYLITRRDLFFTREEFCRLAGFFSDAKSHIKIPPPAIFKPRRLWTGRQLISLMVRAEGIAASRLNFETKERFYTGQDKYMCAKDGYVCFYRGELVAGAIGKKTLGGESKSGLFYALIREQDHGHEKAVTVMNRLAKLSSRFLCDYGFSIGIEDVTPPEHLDNIKDSIVKTGVTGLDEHIMQYEAGTIKLKPGCNPLQSLESDANGLLGKIRQTCGDEAMKELLPSNSALIMAESGAKGSALNISQMIACLGQQSVAGQRIANGFDHRTLPHFKRGSLCASSKGFVANSFYSGLIATEFFFHTMGGREGLVDTAVKTAETGYMARRLMKALEDLSLQYDNTVRNSEQAVVQFRYGADLLNPHMMELGDRPVNYQRLLKNYCAEFHHDDEIALSSSQIRERLEIALLDQRFVKIKDYGSKFIEETRNYFNDLAEFVQGFELKYDMSLLAKKNVTLKSLRLRLSEMNEEERKKWRTNSKNESNIEYHENRLIMQNNVFSLKPSQMKGIIESALKKYEKAIIEPGEAVGAIGAQSLSEPGTQMTLKTFHFAGVASMNVTLGVPRLKEIINASKLISTPIIEAQLVQNDNLTSARIVKAQIEKTTLGQIAKSIAAVHNNNSSFVLVELDVETIRNLHLKIDEEMVSAAILECSTPGIIRALKPDHIYITDEYDHIKGSSKKVIHVFCPDISQKTTKIDDYDSDDSEEDDFGRTIHDKKNNDRNNNSDNRSRSNTFDSNVDMNNNSNDNGKTEAQIKAERRKQRNKHKHRGINQQERLLFHIHQLKTSLPNVIVKGVPSIERAVINEATSSNGTPIYSLLLEGYGLPEVMGANGVDGRLTRSNHIIDMQRVLGIEAARQMISHEVRYIMDQYGISVDIRHLMLLSDVMTFKGEILGITRFGVAKMRESVLMLASFEKTTDHLFDAAVHSREDSIVGVSECIIMGVPIPLGTGLFKLLHQAQEPIQIKKRTRLLDNNATTSR